MPLTLQAALFVVIMVIAATWILTLFGAQAGFWVISGFAVVLGMCFAFANFPSQVIGLFKGPRS